MSEDLRIKYRAILEELMKEPQVVDGQQAMNEELKRIIGAVEKVDRAISKASNHGLGYLRPPEGYYVSIKSESDVEITVKDTAAVVHVSNPNGAIRVEGDEPKRKIGVMTNRSLVNVFYGDKYENNTGCTQ